MGQTVVVALCITVVSAMICHAVHWSTPLAGLCGLVVGAGYLAKKLATPASVVAWKKGAMGEKIVAQRLLAVPNELGLTLHDRRIPGSRANIDHIVVGPRGVFIIDAKNYSGALTFHREGSFLSQSRVLRVNGRSAANMIRGLNHQKSVVEKVLRSAGATADIVAVLCFVSAEWPAFASPQLVNDVVVCWPKKLPDIVGVKGPLTPAERQRLYEILARGLPSA